MSDSEDDFISADEWDSEDVIPDSKDVDNTQNAFTGDLKISEPNGNLVDESSDTAPLHEIDDRCEGKDVKEERHACVPKSTESDENPIINADPDAERCQSTSHPNSVTSDDVVGQTLENLGSPDNYASKELSAPDTESKSATSIPTTAKGTEIDPERSTEDEWNNDDWGWEASLESAVGSATSAMTSVFHKFEQTLGIPDPASMAKVVAEETKLATQGSVTNDAGKSADIPTVEKKDISDNQQHGSWFSSGWGSWGVSGLSDMVQAAGKDLVGGSLDTLEYLGKKTIGVITEGDPGIREKTQVVLQPFLKKEATLSEVLKEARCNRNEPEIESSGTKQRVLFRDLFDQFQGFTHLEALEMLSNECEIKLQRILKVQSDEALAETKQTLLLIKEKFESETDVDDLILDQKLPEKIKAIIGNLNLSVNSDKLISAFKRALSLTTDGNLTETSGVSAFVEMMTGLAEVTCRSLELIHKISELILLPSYNSTDADVSKAQEVKMLLQLLKPVGNNISALFAERLNETFSEDSTNFELADHVTDLHLEGSNCSSYIDDCHRLLLPILQLAAIK